MSLLLLLMSLSCSANRTRKKNTEHMTAWPFEFFWRHFLPWIIRNCTFITFCVLFCAKKLNIWRENKWGRLSRRQEPRKKRFTTHATFPLSHTHSQATHSQWEEATSSLKREAIRFLGKAGVKRPKPTVCRSISISTFWLHSPVVRSPKSICSEIGQECIVSFFF